MDGLQFTMENPVKMDDLGVPPFMETPIFIVSAGQRQPCRLEVLARPFKMPLGCGISDTSAVPSTARAGRPTADPHDPCKRLETTLGR